MLHLDDCYYTSSDDVERLKEVVVDVIWDGVEQEVSTDRDSEEDGNYDSDGNTIEDSDYYDYYSSSSEEL